MRIRSVFTIILFLAASLAAQSVNLPANHWGYRFLERMEAKNLIQSYELRTRPIPRDRAATLALQIAANVDKLSRTEQRLLAQLLGDLHDEVIEQDSTRSPRPEPHLLRYSEPSVGRFYFDLHGKQSVIVNRGHQYQPNELISETAYGGALRGALGGAIGFYAQATNMVRRGEETAEERFDAAGGAPVVTSGANVIRDEASAYFVWEQPWLRLQAGRDDLVWGPALRQGVTLSRNMPPADALRLDVRFKHFKFTSAHMWLRSDLGPKYMTAHRLDIRVLPGFYLGGGETVIYADRNVEPAYLNPLMFYHVAEHHLGDKDNNALHVDATLTRIPNTTLYAEWFIDDMTSSESWSNYFGNKFAFSLGALVVDPFGIPNLDLKAEYNRINPYVYSHQDSINIYTHYDKIIGHPAGPNADVSYVELGMQFNRDFRAETYFEFTRKGEGSANTNSIPTEITKKNMLQGTLETRRAVGIRLEDQIRRDLFVALSYTYMDTRNLNQVVGKTSIDHLARFELYFNY